MIGVEYISPIEFQSPARHGILVPCLVPFFGAITVAACPA
jgi:hypothetical protein